MSKRAAAEDLPPPPPKRRNRRPDPWYVRIGILNTRPGANPYGGRDCVNVSTFLPPNTRDLGGYSLIIPEFTRRRDIPSGEEWQRKQAWLWNTYTHPRYFGLLDLDMDLARVQEGLDPLFTDEAAHPFKDKGEIKAAFAARLMTLTFGECLTLCPPFARLHGAIKNLLAYLEVNGFAYFSGGGGFRVLFSSPYAWRTVTWGTAYAQVFYDQELRPLLQGIAPELEDEDLDILMGSTDKNIYDCDKGTKPDILAHFDTKIFPHPVDEHFESSRCSTTTANESLRADIRAFWVHIFSSIPETPPPLDAPTQKPPIFPHVLFHFPKCNKSEGATHFVLMGEKSSYRKVTDTKQLFEQLIAQRARGEPLNWHEIRTPVTRYFIDYDGGPPLHDPRLCADGTWCTPLRALQLILHESILAGEDRQGGLILTSPPRPGSDGDRAHLIWPGVIVPLDLRMSLMGVVRSGLAARWPTLKWDALVESPLTRRGCFSDKVDKSTGQMSLRPLTFGGVFDPDGDLVDEMVEPSDMELMEVSTNRLDPDTPLSQLQPLPEPPTKKTSASGATFKDLGTEDRTAVEALMSYLLETLRTQHKKPNAKWYRQPKVHDVGTWRHVECGILEHRSCSPGKTHGDNNVVVRVYMDRDEWDMRCRKDGCPYQRTPHPTWGRGTMDTSPLRKAWPKKDTDFAKTLTMDLTETSMSITPPTPGLDLEPSTPPPDMVPTLTCRTEQWDGRYVLVPVADLPGTWSEAHLSHPLRPTETWVLPWDTWTKARTNPYSMVHPYPVRLVPVAGLRQSFTF